MSEIWLIYRVHKDPNTGISKKIETIEYCRTEADARKYARLFDLQTPIDLKNQIMHKYQYAAIY